MKKRLLFHIAAALQLVILVTYRCYASTLLAEPNSSASYLLESISNLSEGCAAGTLAIWLFGYLAMKKGDKPVSSQ